MPVGYSELFLEKGASFNTTITLYDVNNLSYNLVGYTANSQIRKSYYSANAVVTFTTAFSNNIFLITLFFCFQSCFVFILLYTLLSYFNSLLYTYTHIQIRMIIHK